MYFNEEGKLGKLDKLFPEQSRHLRLIGNDGREDKPQYPSTNVSKVFGKEGNCISILLLALKVVKLVGSIGISKEVVSCQLQISFFKPLGKFVMLVILFALQSKDIKVVGSLGKSNKTLSRQSNVFKLSKYCTPSMLVKILWLQYKAVAVVIAVQLVSNCLAVLKQAGYFEIKKFLKFESAIFTYCAFAVVISSSEISRVVNFFIINVLK